VWLLIGALGLGIVCVGLIAASFAARWGAARWLKVPGIGPFGIGTKSDGEPASGLRRAFVHVCALSSTYLVSVLLFVIAFVVVGDNVSTTRVQVLPGPAKEAGMRDGDRIVRVDDQPIREWEELRAAFHSHASTEIRIEIEREGSLQTLHVTPGADGIIRVTPILERRPVGFGSAALRASVQPLRVMADTARGMLGWFQRSEKTELSGPVGMSRAVGAAGARGVGELLYILGLLAAYVWPGFVLLEIAIAVIAARK